MGIGNSTDSLMKMLETSPANFLNNYITKQHEEPSFHVQLKKLMEKKKVRTSTLIKKADISKTYAYQFLNGERLPGRDIVIRICFVLKLTPKQSNCLLTLAENKVLYPRHRRDALILYCLSKKMDINAANDFIEKNGEAALL